VSVGGPQTVALVEDEKDGTYCCGLNTYFYNGSDCLTPTHGNSAVFSLYPGVLIYDRSDGSTSPPSSTGSVVTVTATPSAASNNNTVTVTATTAVGTKQVASNGNISAVGAGVGVSLGVLLLAAVGFIVFLLRRIAVLKQQAGEGARHELAATRVHPAQGPDERGQVHEAESKPALAELDHNGWVAEMEGRRVG